MPVDPSSRSGFTMRGKATRGTWSGLSTRTVGGTRTPARARMWFASTLWRQWRSAWYGLPVKAAPRCSSIHAACTSSRLSPPSASQRLKTTLGRWSPTAASTSLGWNTARCATRTPGMPPRVASTLAAAGATLSAFACAMSREPSGGSSSGSC